MDDKIYGKSYYDNYDVGIKCVNYEDSTYTKDFLTGIAKHIVDDLKPTTVLDAGCAMGHLVAALRDLGVEAFGIDVSEYAISKVREDARQYCAVGSIVEELPDSFPETFDLIVSIEVLEHLYEADGKAAIGNLCKHTNQFLFCSTPDDFDDPTHLNVRQREYWARCFAEAGFYDDVNYRPTYLTYYASFFRRSNDWVKQIEDYERNIRISESNHKNDLEILYKALEDKEKHIQNQQSLIDKYELMLKEGEEKLKANEWEIENLTKVLKAKDELLDEQNDRLYNSDSELSKIHDRIDALESSTTWRATKPIRFTMDVTKQAIGDIRRAAVLSRKGVDSLRKYGFKYTFSKVFSRAENINSYSKWMSKPLFTDVQLKEQKNHTFSKDITFSILVPLYNTPDSFLHEMIDSVLAQTYSKWELCLADGSDSSHGQVEKLCKKYAEADNRIKYCKLEKNLGISGNTNACIEMSTGDYIALFDHDDILHPAALYEMMVAICDKDADMVYTDEATFESPDINKLITIHFKPDFAPDNLRANNYICHFTAFARELISVVGMFDARFDGSQDHDYILRLTSAAKSIVHIPEVLYFWRSHPESVAQNIDAKEYAINAGKSAVLRNIASLGMSATVESSRAFPTIYRISYELDIHPKISIVIPNRNSKTDLWNCINSIIERTTYDNYEIIVVENNSNQKDIFEFYRELESKYTNIKVITWEGDFNFSAINNYAVENKVSGEYILLLNNDTEVISPRWIEEMLMYGQRSDVGAVGAMLYYPDDTIQHAGIILGLGGVAGHCFRKTPKGHVGYMGRLCYSQNMSAVTAACMLVRRNVWDEVKGMDEGYAVAYGDVDFCMKIREAGYLIIWTPYAELYHYESKSRGDDSTGENKKRFESEARRFENRWSSVLENGDPYYNPNLTLERPDFSLR